MTSRRRTLTSPAVVADLRRKLYADNHQQQPPYGDLLKRIEQFFDQVFLYIWLVVIVSAPLVLIALIVGLGNFTVQWLYAAGIALLGSLMYIASLVGLYSANSLAAGDKRGLKGIIGSLVALISIGLLGWVIGVPKSKPPSVMDIRLALFCGFWFATWLIGLSIHSLVTDTEKTRTAHALSLLGSVFYGSYAILTACSFAWSWSTRPDMRFWINVQPFLSYVVIGVSAVTSYMSQPQKAVSESARKNISCARRIAVGAVMLLFLVWLFTMRW